MIRHHLPASEPKKLSKFQIDEKKLVKAFIYNSQGQWVEYFTGFLFMEPDEDGKVNLKIRFSRHPHLKQIEAGVRYPLELHSDQDGLFTLIRQQKIKTVQKPEQNVLYLKVGQEGAIIAISFHSKAYCKILLEHLALVLENNESDEMTWTEQNLEFLNASMKENLMYVDSVFILEERITEFLNFFNKVDKRLYLNPEKDVDSADEKYMVQFFQIVKSVFVRGNQKIIMNFIRTQYNFDTVLKCLSYNPFGVCHFDYLSEFKRMTVINSPISEFQNSEFFQKYQTITRVKFLRDVAICTFIEIPTDAVFNEVLAKAHLQILQTFSSPRGHLIQKLQQLSHADQYKFICVFSEIWQIFKAVLQDSETAAIKEMFYLEWIQNAMFSQTLSAMGRLLKKRQVSDFHPRFWHKWLESMNPMLSYEWKDSQNMILHHQSTHNTDQTADLMGSLILILANSDSNTKVLVLDFVRVQIQVSQNRKQISAMYLSYVYDSFVNKSLQFCNNQEDIEKYIEFVQKIYIAQPIRTRHFIVETNFFHLIKHHMSSKFVFIMLLKLLKTFIEVGDNDTFRYLETTDIYNCFRDKYAENQNLKNITNSLFLSIFKAAQNMSNKESKKYLYRIIFQSDLEKQVSEETKKYQVQEPKVVPSFKRSVPASGFQNQMDVQK